MHSVSGHCNSGARSFRSRWLLLLVLVTLALVLRLDSFGAERVDGCDAPAPQLEAKRIVVLRRHPGEELAEELQVEVQSVGDMHYIAGQLSDSLIAELSRRDLVSYVEDDAPVTTSAAKPATASDTQGSPPSWGLDRLDQAQLPLDNRYTFPKSSGRDVNVYVLDTGVNVGASEFEGRAVWQAGFGAAGSGPKVDDVGHGTFVAAVIAGKQYGVAKKANIISVKVYRKQNDQTTEDVLQALRWILDQHQKSSNKKTVLNMSSGSPYNQALNDAVRRLTNSGVIVVTSAGNSGEQNRPFDSCNHSPSSEPSVISVGATDREDRIADFSNTGRCITLFAPGKDVQSLSSSGQGGSITNSGTSFATPYVSGVVALLLGEEGVLSPAVVKQRLTAAATRGAIKSISTSDGTPNLLLSNKVVVYQPGSGPAEQNTGSGNNSSSGGGGGSSTKQPASGSGAATVARLPTLSSTAALVAVIIAVLAI